MVEVKDIFENLYSGLKNYKGLINLSPQKKQRGLFSDTFPTVGFINADIKAKLEKALSVKIRTVEFYEQALTHRSFLTIYTEKTIYSNERLEFLGDAVIGMIIAEYLFTMNSHVQEGELTKLRARLVNKAILAFGAKQLGIDKFLKMSYGAEKMLESGSYSILGDAMEAVIAAIYIDSGIEATRTFIISVLMPILLAYEKDEDENYKSILLETVQAKGQQHPVYEVLESVGPDHDKHFRVAVSVSGTILAVGNGKSKKAAEQDAAKNAIPKAEIMFN